MNAILFLEVISGYGGTQAKYSGSLVSGEVTHELGDLKSIAAAYRAARKKIRELRDEHLNQNTLHIVVQGHDLKSADQLELPLN